MSISETDLERAERHVAGVAPRLSRVDRVKGLRQPNKSSCGRSVTRRTGLGESGADQLALA